MQLEIDDPETFCKEFADIIRPHIDATARPLRDRIAELGQTRTSRGHALMSAFDPKRTWGDPLGVTNGTIFDPKM